MNTTIDRLPIQEVAQALGTTPLNVLMHIKRGYLEGVEEEGGWTISGESLMVFMARDSGRKRQFVCATSCSKGAGCGGSCS